MAHAFLFPFQSEWNSPHGEAGIKEQLEVMFAKYCTVTCVRRCSHGVRQCLLNIAWFRLEAMLAKYMHMYQSQADV